METHPPTHTCAEMEKGKEKKEERREIDTEKQEAEKKLIEK